MIKLRNFPEAERRIQLALRRAPNVVLVHLLRIRLLKGVGRLDEVGGSLDLVRESESNSLGTLKLKSAALRDLGKYEEAIEVIDRGLSIEPEHGWLLEAKGELLVRWGRYAEAEAVRQRCAAHRTESGRRSAEIPRQGL